MTRMIKKLVKKLGDKDAEIKLLKSEKLQDKGMHDCEMGRPASSDNEYYLAGYGFAYARRDQTTGLQEIAQ